jgi:hypothetical protein
VFGKWQLRTEGRLASTRSTGREWTRDSCVGGGAIFENQREVFSPKQRCRAGGSHGPRAKPDAEARRCEPIALFASCDEGHEGGTRGRFDRKVQRDWLPSKASANRAKAMGGRGKGQRPAPGP